MESLGELSRRERQARSISTYFLFTIDRQKSRGIEILVKDTHCKTLGNLAAEYGCESIP